MSSLRSLARSFVAVLGIAGASLGADDSTRQLFKGRLVGTQFRNAVPATGPASLSLQFLLLEEYALAFGEEGVSLLSAHIPGEVDVAALRPENFATTIDRLITTNAAHGATGVQLGGECLVEVEWTGVDRKLVALERFDEQARRAFLERNAAYLVEVHSKVVEEFEAECRRRVDLALSSAKEKRALAKQSQAEAGANDPLAAPTARLAVWEGLQMSRKMASASRMRLESSAAVLAKLRDAASPAVRATVEPILAQVPARLKTADECEARLVAALAEDPREAIDRDLNATSQPPAARSDEPKR